MGADQFFQIIEKPRLSQEVARQIAQTIREGRFLPGVALPPERELTVKFNVSRPILREALSILELQGYITVKHGRGAFVKNPDSDILNVPLNRWLGENIEFVNQFYEARIAIEPACAALAAVKATKEDVAELRAILQREEKLVNGENIASFVSVDIDFHSAIARIAGNVFLIKMLNSLITPETDVRKVILRLPNHQPTTHSDHYGILRAIEKHTPETARKVMIAALRKPLEVINEYMKSQEKAE
jgi:GntR family transcriptional repressor for pyruvate dehydrogenase complex